MWWIYWLSMQDYKAGLVQALIVTAVGYPFDTVKVKLQSGQFNRPSECIRHVLDGEKKSEKMSKLSKYSRGVAAFYKGVSMPFLSHTSKRPIQYTLGEYLKRTTSLSNYWIGMMVGPIGSLIGTPLQVVKIRAQTQNSKSHQQISKIWRSVGPTGFYRGLVPNMFKDALFGMSYIGHYYTMRDKFGNKTALQNCINGITANCLTWATFIPFDYVKTNIQKQTKQQPVFDLILTHYRRYGWRVFWRGLKPAFLRTFPVSGLSMMGYEYIRKHGGSGDTQPTKN